MPVFFVAPGVAILETVPTLKKYWWQFLLITVVSFLFVFFVAGHTSQGLIKLFGKHKKEKAVENQAEEKK